MTLADLRELDRLLLLYQAQPRPGSKQSEDRIAERVAAMRRSVAQAIRHATTRPARKRASGPGARYDRRGTPHGGRRGVYVPRAEWPDMPRPVSFFICP